MVIKNPLLRFFKSVWVKFPSLNRPIWKLWYQYISGLDKEASVVFMNYGFADIDLNKKIKLKPVDEKDRYSIQLYHHVASVVDLKGKDLLEVGCGRGGGSSYIMRYLKPKSIVGADFSNKAIEFCKNHYSVKGLLFCIAAAESLPFDDNKFDVVINVESSHCYMSMERFLSEVFRILKPCGYFILADFRYKKDINFLQKQLKHCGFELVTEENITQNVLRSLDFDNKRKRLLIKEKVPKFFQNTFLEFAGTKGSGVYESFKTGEIEYFNFTLQKK